MKLNANNFVQLSAVAVRDEVLQTAVTRATNGASSNRVRALREVSEAHGEALRQQAAAAKRRALHSLPELLEQAEAKMQANGITVLWAVDAAEARQHILDIARRHQVRRIVKSKSMATEEIGLNDVLETNNIETIETDLGEYIIQLNHEAPSHIVAPVIHKTKESIRDIFIREIAMPPTDDAATMARYARGQLRDAFLTADMGVSGGNFIIAETGTLCLVTNEGNGRMVTSVPPVHVALIGIEKIVPTLRDYATLVQMIARAATGQKLSVYGSMVNGPRRAGETDGPDHVYVVLLDNGRSNIYTNPDYVEALACLRCGACLNACPVYQAAGGHSYGWVYPGPIGAVVTPLLNGIENASPLPFASSLCGSCKQACPVDIDLPRMLLTLRRDLVQRGTQGRIWDVGMKLWAMGNSSPTAFRLGGKVASLASNAIHLQTMPGPLGGWTDHRAAPQFAPKSFRELWAEREKGAQNEQ